MSTMSSVFLLCLQVYPPFEQEIRHIEGERRDSIIAIAERFRIDLTMASLIVDVALAEGISPDLGARLVRVESAFNPSAVSYANAIGLAQVLLSTAQEVVPGITLRGLFDPKTNLHVGFRYLRRLLDYYGGDVELALYAYNMGLGRVNGYIARGERPRSSYARDVLF